MVIEFRDLSPGIIIEGFILYSYIRTWLRGTQKPTLAEPSIVHASSFRFEICRCLWLAFTTIPLLQLLPSVAVNWLDQWATLHRLRYIGLLEVAWKRFCVSRANAERVRRRMYSSWHGNDCVRLFKLVCCDLSAPRWTQCIQQYYNSMKYRKQKHHNTNIMRQLML